MEDEKISISLADVKHLQLQFAKDATEKLDLYLPTTDTSDPLKSTVASLVDDFIYEIFENAKGGLDVDGMRESDELRSLLDNPTKEVEPFDFSLQEQVRRLYQEVEEETIKLTNLRRETPQNLKKRYEESFNRSFEQIESLHREIETLEEDTDDERELRFMRLRPRLEHMSQEYSQSIRDIKYIKDNIPKEHGELDKLEKITKFLVSKK